MSQDALSPKLQLPNIKPFKINDLAGAGPPKAKIFGCHAKYNYQKANQCSC